MRRAGYLELAVRVRGFFALATSLVVVSGSAAANDGIYLELQGGASFLQEADLSVDGFGGGSVDITSGRFVFSASEAYLIEDGRLGAPVRGATLIGNGPEVLTRISRVGHDLALDLGIGTCGKDGQSVPVGVGLPTVRIDGLTVGGTQA